MSQAQDVLQRYDELKSARASWLPLWQDIRDHMLPDFGNFPGEDATLGSKRYRRVLDATAIESADTLSSGLYSGVSSPSRPWLKLSTLDPELDEFPQVKEWLEETQRLMLLFFAKAGVYSHLQQAYLELPTFGQSCVIARPHPDLVVNLQNVTVGEYCIAEDDFGFVDTLYRTIGMTAKQAVQQWGLDAVSPTVRAMYLDKPFSRVNVLHAIEPRWERDETKVDGANKPWRSVYIDMSEQKILSESGFDEFPAMCPRWQTCGGSAYGRGPGAKALSAAKSLQFLQKSLADLAAYQCNPPVQYPSSFKGALDLLRPGGRIPVDAANASAIRSAWQVDARPDAVLGMIAARQDEIRKLFYTNVFQMFASSQDADRTATEVMALEQEKIMMFGPVLERIHSELLDPLVASTFAFMIQQGRVPEPPEELYKKPLNVEYISVLAQRQNNASADGIIRLSQEIGMLAQINPSAVDKLDTDATIEKLADINGVPRSLIVSGEQVALIRQQRAQEQQRMAQQQEAAQMAQTLKDLTPALQSSEAQETLESYGPGM